MIGEFVAAAPDGTNILIVSDHGMGSINQTREFTPELPVSQLRSGGHREAPPGIIVAAWPDFRRADPAPDISSLRREDLTQLGTIMDITPSLLALFGIPLGRDMEGSVSAAWLAAEHADPAVHAWIDSHTPEGWRAEPGAVTEVDGEIRIEQLRALGYIDSVDE